MLDFSTLIAAQPPLPHSLPIIQSLPFSTLHLDGEGRAMETEGRNLPEFSAAALQYLSKLSPSLQKAALSALLKPRKRKTKVTEEPFDSNPRHSTITSPNSFPPTDSSFATIPESSSIPPVTTTARPTTKTTSTTLPTTTTTTTTTARTEKVPIKRHIADEDGHSHPTFHWDDGTTTTKQHWRRAYEVDSFSSNALDTSRQGLAPQNSGGDAGIILLIGIFNLLAIVVYAAHRHVTNRPSLPNRVLDWQVQKVLDELVLRVHSSKDASQLLARSLPETEFNLGFSGRSINSQNGLQLITAAKSLLLKVASSPEAINSAKLPVGIYRPLTSVYQQVSEDLKEFVFSGNKSSEFEGRGMKSADEKSPTWLQILLEAGQLSSIQWDSFLRTLTMIGQSRSLMSSQGIAKALMSALMTPEGTARNFGSVDFQVIMNVTLNNIKNEKNSSSISFDQDLTHFASNSIPNMPTKPEQKGSRMMRRMGFVEDAGGLVGAGGEIGDHWSSRWFSLVTRLSPVALDATTLYARAHSSPVCLRSLLCSINFSWKKVGPLQAALTPLLRWVKLTNFFL